MSGTADALMALDAAGVPADDPQRQALLQQLTAQGHRLAFQGGGVGPGAVSMVSPEAKTEQGETYTQAPGLVYDLYARFGRLLPAIASGMVNFANDPNIEAGDTKPVDIPPIPGTETAEKHVADATRWALDTVPRPTPQSKEDELDLARGVNIGQAISPIAPMSLYSRLPSVVSGVGRFFVPATTDVLPIVALSKAAQQLPDPKPAGGGQSDNSAAAPVTNSDTDVSPAALKTNTPQPSTPPAQQPFDVRPTPTPSQGPTDSGLTEAELGGLILGGGASVWAALKFGPRAINETADIVRSLRTGLPSDAAAVSQLYDDVRVGRNVNMAPGAQMPDMPLPGNASGPTRRFAAAVQNSNAVVDELDRAIATSKQAGEEAVAQNHQINQQGSLTTRMESQMRTGESPTGRSGPAMIDNRILVDQMSDAQRELANKGAWARNELSNRADPARGGNPATYNGTPLTLPNVDSNTLRVWRMQADADPLVRQWLDHWDQTVQFVNHDMELSGMITPSQAQRGRALYSEWMPTVRQDGSIVHSWDPRPGDATVGWTMPPVNAWDAQSRWYDEAYRQMQLNAWRRERLLSYDNFIQSNPQYRGLLEWQSGPSETATNRMTIYTSNGPRYVDINNQPLFHVLNDGPTQMAHVAGWVGGLKRMLSSAVVGPIAALGGNIFALKHMGRFMMAGGSQLPRDIYRGYLDRMLSQSIGMRLPWDPSVLAGVPFTAARDMGSVFAKNFGDILASSDHPITNSLRAVIGQPGVDAWRNWLYHRYNTSNMAERAAAGVSGGGSYGIRDVNPRIQGQDIRVIDPLHNVSPIQGHDWTMASARSPLGQLGKDAARAAVTSSVNLRSLIRDMHGAILDAVNGFVYDTNKTNPAIMNRGQPNTRYLGHIAQSMIGDPATMGSNAAVKQLMARAPLLNIATQATAATARSFKNHPLMYTAGMVIPSFIAALSSQLSAINSGPDHVKHLEEHMSNAQKEGNIIWYHGKGTDPNQNTQVSLPQPFRWFYPYANALTSSALGVFRSDGFQLQALEHMLAEFFSKHISTDTLKQMGLGAAESVPLATTPATNLVLALGGARDPGRITTDVASNIQEDKPLNQGLLTQPTPSRIPGQEERGIWNGMVNDDTLKGVMTALAGGAGTVAHDILHNGIMRWDQTHDPSWVWQGVKSDYSQTFAEQNKEGNFIWKANMPMGVHGPNDEKVNRAVANLRETLHAQDDIRNQGVTRQGGIPVQVTGKSPVPEDPQMRWLYATMGQYAQQVEQRTMPHISDMYKQLQTLKDSPMMADEKRRISNEINMNISAAKHKLLDEMEVVNEFVSQRLGKNIDISKKIDWTKGTEQFR